MPIRTILLLLALLRPDMAEEAEPAKPKSGGIQMRLLAEQVPANLGKVYLLFDKSKSPAFALPTNTLSAAVPVPSRAMVLKTEDKDIPLCSVTLPETGKAFAVILVTARPAGYSPIIVRTDDPSFKAGDVYFINRSRRTVLGKLGGTSLALEPGATAKNRPTSPRENSYYDVSFGTREEDGYKLMSSSRWPVDSQLRSYVFFFTNADARTTFRAVDEYIPPPPAGKP